MTTTDEPWVQRLRDGTVPRRGPVLLAAAVTMAVGVAASVAEFAFPDFLRSIDTGRMQTTLFLVPLLVAASGIVLAVSTLSSGRSDRRTLARIRAGRAQRFHLPVLASGLRTTDDLAGPRPAIWTVDEFGLHAWAPSRDTPVLDLPWARVRRFAVATKAVGGQRVAFGIWITTTDGADVVVQPRTALGRGSEAGAGKLDTLVRILRSLQRELGSDRGAADRH